MIKFIAFASFALALATSAQAMPRVPLHQPDGMTTQVRYYGYGHRRYGYGGYRHYGNRYYGYNYGYRHYGYSGYRHYGIEYRSYGYRPYGYESRPWNCSPQYPRWSPQVVTRTPN